MQHSRLSFATLCVIFCLLLAFGCSKEKKREEVSIGRTINAETTKVRCRELPKIRYFPGHVRSKVSITLAARMPGYVKKVTVHIGDQVKKGDLLVLVDDTDAKARINALLAAKRSARSRREALSAKYEYARINFERFKRLLKEESATKDEFDRAKTEYLALKNQIKAIDADIVRIKARLKEAENQLSYLKIKAPMDGWISDRKVDPGTYVNPGLPLISLDGKGAGFWFEAQVDDSLVSRIKKGETVTVSIPALDLNRDIPVVHIQPSSQLSTHTFTLLADLGSMELKSGLFGRMFVSLGTRPAIVLPENVIVNRGGISGVYTVDESKVVHWRLIKTGKMWREVGGAYLPVIQDISPAGKAGQRFVTVVSGLSPGEVIVSSNLPGTREGCRLEQ